MASITALNRPINWETFENSDEGKNVIAEYGKSVVVKAFYKAAGASGEDDTMTLTLADLEQIAGDDGRIVRDELDTFFDGCNVNAAQAILQAAMPALSQQQSVPVAPTPDAPEEVNGVENTATDAVDPEVIQTVEAEYDIQFTSFNPNPDSVINVGNIMAEYPEGIDYGQQTDLEKPLVQFEISGRTIIAQVDRMYEREGIYYVISHDNDGHLFRNEYHPVVVPASLAEGKTELSEEEFTDMAFRKLSANVTNTEATPESISADLTNDMQGMVLIVPGDPAQQMIIDEVALVPVEPATNPVTHRIVAYGDVVNGSRQAAYTVPSESSAGINIRETRSIDQAVGRTNSAAPITLSDLTANQAVRDIIATMFQPPLSGNDAEISMQDYLLLRNHVIPQMLNGSPAAIVDGQAQNLSRGSITQEQRATVLQARLSMDTHFQSFLETGTTSGAVGDSNYSESSNLLEMNRIMGQAQYRSGASSTAEVTDRVLANELISLYTACTGVDNRENRVYKSWTGPDRVQYRVEVRANNPDGMTLLGVYRLNGEGEPIMLTEDEYPEGFSFTSHYNPIEGDDATATATQGSMAFELTVISLDGVIDTKVVASSERPNGTSTGGDFDNFGFVNAANPPIPAVPSSGSFTAGHLEYRQEIKQLAGVDDVNTDLETNKPDRNILKTILIVVAVILGVIVLIMLLKGGDEEEEKVEETTATDDTDSTDETDETDETSTDDVDDSEPSDDLFGGIDSDSNDESEDEPEE